MKHCITLFVIFSLFVTKLYSQGIKSTEPFSDKPTSDLLFLLPVGEYEADVLDSANITPRQLELLMKFQEALKNVIQNDFEWYSEFSKSIQPGQPMPYNKKFGLSKKEYEDLQEYLNNIELVSSGKCKIKIMKEDDIIIFKGDGKLKILDYFKFDLKKNVVLMEDEILNYIDKSKITDTTNAFKSEWEGYNWELKEPKDMDMDALKDLSAISSKNYEVTAGRVNKNNSTFISIKISVINEGKSQGNADFSILF